MKTGDLSSHEQTSEPIRQAEGRSTQKDIQQYGSAARRAGRILSLLTIASLLGIGVCLQFGAEPIGFQDMMRIMRQAAIGEESAVPLGAARIILLEVRLPRVLLGFLVGGCLAGVGVVLQAVMRNPLADPYVLGVSSGAALGASIAVLFGIGTSVLALSALPLCGFIGGLLALTLVYGMAVTRGELSAPSLLLAGVILNAIFSALIMFITSIMEPNRSFGMMAWLMGSLSAHVSPGVTVLSLYLFGGLAMLWRDARRLNIMALGDDMARTLGVDPRQVTRRLFVTTALITGAVVSVSGLIGFIGMIIPHAARMVFGADNRLLLPASILIGGLFLVIADTAARTLLAPTEMPVGIITALAGGPFFIYLLMRRSLSTRW